MKRIVFFFSLSLLCTHFVSAEDLANNVVFPAEILPEKSVLSADTVTVEEPTDGRLGALEIVFTFDTHHKGRFLLLGIGTGETIVNVPLSVDGSDIILDEDPSTALPAGLAAVIFQEGCRRWHKNRRNYWRFCTGRENCGGGSFDRGRRWCLQRVPRNRCETQNTCPTSSSIPDTAIFGVDFPLALRPPSEELRYCCRLECEDITNPRTCRPECEKVPVGPCAVFTVDCPGRLSEGHCTWD